MSFMTPMTSTPFSLSPSDTSAKGQAPRFAVSSPWKKDKQRAAPSVLLRSALWRPQRSYDEVLVRKEIAANRGVSLKVTGTALSMLDLDVWLLVCHIGRNGDRILINLCQFVRELGRARGGRAVTGVRASLERLHAFRIELDVENKRNPFYPDRPPDRYGYRGQLLDALTWRTPGDANTWDVEIDLNPGLSPLFEPFRRTIFDERRARIGHNPVALWIYGQIRSHTLMRPLPPRYFYRLSGSRSTEREFSTALERALALLKNRSLIYDWELRDGKIFVLRTAPKIPRRSSSLEVELPDDGDDESVLE
jgi:hypothetical protein